MYMSEFVEFSECVYRIAWSLGSFLQPAFSSKERVTKGGATIMLGDMNEEIKSQWQH